ncbi:cation:proton antiporter [uncultured Algimonas sp.]|uniref:cation:proton antiporter n=1 Tax=uncultured Algimonas sp. TaxID=1547920 RepID=UPI0026249FEA|nr:cation:proton antiporter [uncultured Algimonas sp.]
MIETILSNPIACFYAVIGFALFGLTLQPGLARRYHVNLPAVYIALGAVVTLLGFPHISPLGSELQANIITHASELIVIVSLTAAGLAIDLKAGWRRWNATWRLLGIAMPLTILALIFLGQWAGLGLAGAVLLGASLAPTDPVLARSVQVGGPGEEEDPTRIALTAEAGLNDGLAFPFVWAAIALAAGSFDWTGFLTYDVLYRVGMGVAIGWGVGWVISRLVFSKVGDATNERSNPLIVMLAATFLAYGLAEFVHAYGFLSVFIAARSGRRHDQDAEIRGHDDEAYATEAHESADQFEGILMVLLLLWFGTFVAAELWHQWRWSDLLIAIALLFVVRPIAGWLALTGMHCAASERFKIAFFGIRGMGTIFYIAYAQTHAPFDDIDAVWRIAGLCILISVLMHESLAGWLFNRSKVAIPAGGTTDADTHKV